MEKCWYADYRMEDHIYRIYENSETHKRLSSDETFLKRHINESTANPEFVAVVDANEGSHTFKWDAKATKLMIELYNANKNKFRDPKIRKKALWSEMALNMKEAGYNVDEELLDRKLRNMKKTYKTIKDNNSKNSTGRGRVSWEYFDVFEEIFSNDLTINCGPVVSSLVSNDVDSNMSAPCSPSSPLPICEDESPFKMKRTGAAISMSSLFYMRKKMVEAEERKAAASEDLNRVLRETNKILQERNELLRQLLQTRNN